jgi:hypothetical protein
VKTRQTASVPATPTEMAAPPGVQTDIWRHDTRLPANSRADVEQCVKTR